MLSRLLLTGLLASTLVFAQWGGGGRGASSMPGTSPGETRMDRLTSALKLSKDQRKEIKAAMDDDLNVSGALAAVFDLVRELNRRIDARSLSTADAASGAAALRDFDGVLGVLDVPESLTNGAQALLDQRTAAREAREWATSDRLRDELAAMGVPALAITGACAPGRIESPRPHPSLPG